MHATAIARMLDLLLECVCISHAAPMQYGLEWHEPSFEARSKAQG